MIKTEKNLISSPFEKATTQLLSLKIKERLAKILPFLLELLFQGNQTAPKDESSTLYKKWKNYKDIISQNLMNVWWWQDSYGTTTIW